MATAFIDPDSHTRKMTPWETSQTEVFLDAVELLFAQLQQIQNQRARVFPMYCRRAIRTAGLRLGSSHAAVNEYLDNEGSALLYRDYERPLFNTIMDSIPHLRRHLREQSFSPYCAAGLKNTIGACIQHLRVQREAEQVLESLLTRFDFSARGLSAIDRYQRVVGI